MDERVSKLNTTIQETMKAIIPARKRQYKAWISDETLEMAKIKRQLKQRRQESNDITIKYRKQCNMVRKAATMDKERWLQEIEGNVKENRSRQVYKLLKKMNKKLTPTQSIIKDKNGKILQDK